MTWSTAETEFKMRTIEKRHGFAMVLQEKVVYAFGG